MSAAKPKFGGSPKCFSCGKSVYAAEEKKHEDKTFHNICFGAWWKAQEKAKHDEWSEKNYGKKNDTVSPEYYRVSTPEGAVE